MFFDETGRDLLVQPNAVRVIPHGFTDRHVILGARIDDGHALEILGAILVRGKHAAHAYGVRNAPPELRHAHAVVIDADGMKMQALNIGRQTEWPFVTDEMNLVTSQCELFTECSCENSAPTDGGVAGDADVEWIGGH